VELIVDEVTEDDEDEDDVWLVVVGAGNWKSNSDGTLLASRWSLDTFVSGASSSGRG